MIAAQYMHSQGEETRDPGSVIANKSCPAQAISTLLERGRVVRVSSEHSGLAQVVTTLRDVFPNSGFLGSLVPPLLLSLSRRVGEKPRWIRPEGSSWRQQVQRPFSMKWPG